MSAAPFALSLNALTDVSFWISVGTLAGIYTVFALGLQLNAGFTGLYNFGQAGFMAIGAYSMAILVLDAGLGFLVALPLAVLITVGCGLLIGLPTLRLRGDYFAIVTIAAAEMVRLVLQNAKGLTGGNQGLFGYDAAWVEASETIEGWLRTLGWSDPDPLMPLLLVTWLVVLVAGLGLAFAQRSPWGRVLRSIREDEDAARALGKNVFSFKLQSLAIAAALGAIAGFLLALNLAFLNPEEFEPLFTFIGYSILILGGLGSYRGVAVGAIVIWTLLEGTRYVELPLSEVQVASLRFMIVGAILIGLMAFRPQGILGKREEMVLGE